MQPSNLIMCRTQTIVGFQGAGRLHNQYRNKGHGAEDEKLTSYHTLELQLSGTMRTIDNGFLIIVWNRNDKNKKM